MQRLGLLGGIGLATLGTLGVAGAGIVWNFQGKTFGLSATIASLVLLSIGVVLLRPLPQETSIPEADDVDSKQSTSKGISVQRPQASLIGLTLAAFGTFTLAGSGILWNFKGIAFGLTGTITALVALLLSLPFLWPIGRRPVAAAVTPKRSIPAVAVQVDPIQNNTEKTLESPITTAEAIAAQLAEAQKNAAEVDLVTFAPDHLLPGRTLPTRSRRPGASIRNGYKGMVEDLFRS